MSRISVVLVKKSKIKLSFLPTGRVLKYLMLHHCILTWSYAAVTWFPLLMGSEVLLLLAENAKVNYPTPGSHRVVIIWCL